MEKTKDVISYEEFIELEVNERYEKLNEFWGFQQNVFIGEYDDCNSSYFTFVRNCKNIDGNKIINPFTKGEIVDLYLKLDKTIKSQKLSKGDKVLFTIKMANEESIKDKVVSVDAKSIRKIENIEIFLDEINNNIGGYSERILKELNDYFTEKTKKYVIYTDENFKNDAKKIVLDIGKETDIIQRKMEREVQEYSKTMDSLMKRYTSLNKEISEIEEKRSIYIQLGLIEDKKEVLDISESEIKGSSNIIKHIHEFLLSKEEPLIYDKEIIEQFVIGLITNQIIILAGAPGSGKTSLVEGVAEAIKANCKIISVRPNWNSSEDLIGFYNPMDRLYIGTPLIDTIIEANSRPNELFFICLDEMNIGCVEQYLSDFLSALYTKNKEITLYSDYIYSDENKVIDEYLVSNDIEKIKELIGIEKYVEVKRRMRNLSKYTPKIKIPDNIRFIGTINRDATTKDLSPKVIDRSMIINLNSSFNNYEKLEMVLANKIEGIEAKYITPKEFEVDKMDTSSVYDEFKEFITLLNENEIELNFRFINAAAKMLNIEGIENRKLKDYIIATKILPKFNNEIDNDKFFSELNKLLLDKDISKEIYISIKSFYEEHRVLSYWR